MQRSDGASYGTALAVVTVTYSPGAALTAFLDSLVDATTREHVVVLADNGSTDGAPERAAAERANVRLLRTGANLGYGGAANRGVASLGPEVGWVVVANPDLVWQPGSLDELLAAAERIPRAGALGPLIRDADGAIYPSARLLPSLARGAGHAVFGMIWPSNPWTTAYRQSDTAISERDAEWLSGSCLLLRRAAFDSVGGFDERYFMYFEDVDLGERLGKAGWRNRYVPSAEVVHTGGHATTANAQVSARMLVEHHRSAYRYLADRHPGPAWAPLRLALRAGLAVRSALAVRAKPTARSIAASGAKPTAREHRGERCEADSEGASRRAVRSRQRGSIAASASERGADRARRRAVSAASEERTERGGEQIAQRARSGPSAEASSRTPLARSEPGGPDRYPHRP